LDVNKSSLRIKTLARADGTGTAILISDAPDPCSVV
jgi:hypothetical protein